MAHLLTECFQVHPALSAQPMMSILSLSVAMEETLLHHDLSMDMASTAIRLAWHHGHTDLARKGLKMLKQKLQSSPELGHLHLLSLVNTKHVLTYPFLIPLSPAFPRSYC